MQFISSLRGKNLSSIYFACFSLIFPALSAAKFSLLLNCIAHVNTPNNDGNKNSFINQSVKGLHCP